MKTYKIADLMTRYGFTTPQGAIRFVQVNLSKINAEGVHAIKRHNKWNFDEEAISIMDELRDTNRITIIEEGNEKIKELTADNEKLREENNRLKEILIGAQKKIIEAMEKEQDLQQQLSSIKLKAVENQSELQLQLTSTRDKLTSTEQQLSSIEIEMKKAHEKIEELENAQLQAKEDKETLLKLQQRNLIERILNRSLS